MWKEKLLSAREMLIASEADHKEGQAAVELDQTKVGRLSRIDAMQVQEMNKAISQRRMIAIKRIDAALERIKEDEYGFCLQCGDEIALKRLELDPAVPLCLSCSK